jgi:hypothetical protein
MKFDELLDEILESVAGVEEDEDGVEDSDVCPNCGQLIPKT